MPTHRYLDEAARAMIAAVQKGHSVRAVLQKRCPHLVRQMRSDGKQPELLRLWGRSCNIDENAGEMIVHPAILQAIGTLVNVPMHGRFVHAGLEHTYGYLFSLIDTPYGRKRQRWITTDLEKGFGFDPTLLGDQPRQGTLLANLTRFLGRIAFRGTARSGFDERLESCVAPEIVLFDYESLGVRRIVERITFDGKKPREISLFTDLVSFPIPPADASKENTLLVYSLQTALRATHRLITAFPVTRQTVNDLVASAQGPQEAVVRLRYNAYLPGLFGRELKGERYLEGPNS